MMRDVAMMMTGGGAAGWAWSTVLVTAMLALLLGGCSKSQYGKYYDPSKPHHAPDSFRNNYKVLPRDGFWKWRWQRFWAGLPKEPEGGFQPEVLKPTPAQLAKNPSLTWLGHATFLLKVGGVTILTDPNLSERASPLSFAGPKRRVPPALTMEELPHIDVVTVSHNHYDHLDLATVVSLNSQPGGPPRYFIPLGMKPWFAAQGITNVVELDWWDEAQHAGLTFTYTPVQHFSARTPWDLNQTLWGGWLVAHPELRFFHAGDTAYSPDFADIRRRLGPVDLAALPIGAYDPRWFMSKVHVNPEEAVAIHQDLEARYSVAMHWGTFELTDETIDEPPQRLAAELARLGIPPERFFLMRHGEVKSLEFLTRKAKAG